MAVFGNRYGQNAPGKYYIDDRCIDCGLCCETAPNIVRRNNEGGHAYFYRQPSTSQEVGLCEEMLAGCPAEAIGDDGDQPSVPHQTK